MTQGEFPESMQATDLGRYPPCAYVHSIRSICHGYLFVFESIGGGGGTRARLIPVHAVKLPVRLHYSMGNYGGFHGKYSCLIFYLA